MASGSAGSVTVAAASIQDATKSGTAIITVSATSPLCAGYYAVTTTIQNPSITEGPSPSGIVLASGSGLESGTSNQFCAGSQVTVTATPGSMPHTGYVYTISDGLSGVAACSYSITWPPSLSLLGTAESCTFTMPSQAVTVTADFECAQQVNGVCQ